VPPSSVHFNGSVNLPDAETVMREISARIPAGVRRMTDGEPGERNYWIHYQIRKFAQMPEFEEVSATGRFEAPEGAPVAPQLRLAAGTTADAIQWPNLGYADEYVGSFAIFDRLQQDGTIAEGTRFQMQYPTPLASIAAAFVPEDLGDVVAAYERALFADLQDALSRVPHDRVAVQWDIAVEFGLLEGIIGPTLPVDAVSPGVVRCVDAVPEDVPVGLHLCYGDYGHEHFKQPESLQMQVDFLNAVVAASARPVNWASFTVPQNRSDAEYFSPLRDLAAAETELYFALVPYFPDDQPDGTAAGQIEHIDAALAGGREWGICTECGMGRVAADDVPRLLDLHRELLAGG
jgi:hypothetical protein